MLTIRPEQMSAFEKAVEENLECRLVAHVQRVFPEPCRQMGEPAVREWIRSGLAAAARYGIQVEYDLCRYVDLMFILAPDFDTGGRFAWAGEILNDGKLSAAEKMDSLWERARSQCRPR